jgi:hypothetical protein
MSISVPSGVDKGKETDTHPSSERRVVDSVPALGANIVVDGGGGESSESITISSLFRVSTMQGADRPAWDEPEKECVGLRNKEGAVANGKELSELPGSFFLKNDVNLAEAEVLFEASLLQWAALSVWAVQLDSPPSPIFTSSLQESQYRVLNAVNSDGCYK